MGRRGPKPDQAKRKAFGRLIADGMPSAISLPNALRLAWSGFGPRRPIATPQTHGCCDVRQNPPSPELAPPPTGFLTFDRVGDQAAGGASFRFAWLVRRRYDDEPVSRMWARYVSRSTTAAASRGSVNVWPHSLNGAFDATAIEARSSRSVSTWNRSSAPRLSRCRYPSSSRYSRSSRPYLPTTRLSSRSSSASTSSLTRAAAVT